MTPELHNVLITLGVVIPGLVVLYIFHLCMNPVKRVKA